MNVVVTVISATLGVLLLFMPVINRRVFHTIDTDEIVIDGREGIKNIQGLQGEGKFAEAVDSADALIDRYTNDSLVFFTPDVFAWDTVRAILTGKRQHRWQDIFLADIDAIKIEPLQEPKTAFPLTLKRDVIKSLNDAKNYVQFYVQRQDSVSLDRQSDLKDRLRDLKQAGIYIESDGKLEVKENVSVDEKNRIARFQLLLIERVLFPEILRKDPRRGTDWASQFVVQTAAYLVGMSYKVQFQLDDAIAVWNRLIDRYPETIYAEVLFLETGKALLSDGKRIASERGEKEGALRYRQAISWLERLEQNREVSSRFPKYKYVDLDVGRYVDVDRASRAKSQVKEKTAIYTTKQADADASGKNLGGSQSGYFLEDAVRLVGETYIQLGLTDSARSQFRLILTFFPESDNLDDAQKLIADSYLREGDLMLAADSTNPEMRRKASELYELAVKEYLKFANVYPQSELISENYIALGDAYNKLTRPEDATKAFASALGRAKEAEDQAKVQLKIGNYFFDRKRYDEAVRAYQIILNNFLSTEVAPNAQYMLGRCYKSKGDTLKAVENFQMIVDNYRKSTFLAGAALEIGDYHLDRGNYRDAEKAYGNYVYDPQSNLAPQMMYKIGDIWRRIANTQDGAAKEKTLQSALEHFRKVVNEFSGKASEADRAAVQIAEIYKELGNEQAAREATKTISDRALLVKVLVMFVEEGQDENAAKEDYFKRARSDAQNDDELATAEYELAMVFAERPEMYDSALASFQRSYELSTKTSRKLNAQVGIARVYSSQKRYKESVDLLKELLQNPKVTPELSQQLRIQLYEAQYREGLVEEALKGFGDFVAELPDHKQTPLAYYRVGSILAERKEYQKAQDKYQVIVDRYSSSDMYDRAVLAIGDQMANKGEHAAAVKYLEEFVKKNPDNELAVNFLMKIGELYSKNLDKKELAIGAFEKVLELKPENAYFSHAAYRAGSIYKELKNDKKAMAAFELVRREDKSVYRASQAELGKYMAAINPEKAIQYYKGILDGAESPDDSMIALIGIGDVYDEIKKYGNAAETFERAYKGYGGNDTNLTTGALVKWANSLINSKQFADAIKACNEMQKRFPEHPLTVNTFYFEANAYTQMKSFGKAREVFAQIIKLNRSKELTEVAYYQMGDLYYFQATSGAEGDARDNALSAAVGEYEKYLAKYPKGQFAARAAYMQGVCHISLTQWKKARAKLMSVVNNHSDFNDICNAKYFLAIALDKDNEYELAAKYCDQVLRGACDKQTMNNARELKESITVRTR